MFTTAGTSSLFGGTSTANPFGQPNQQNPQTNAFSFGQKPPVGAFGSTMNNQPSSLFAQKPANQTSMFGTSVAQPAPLALQSQAPSVEYTEATKFSALNPNEKQKLEEIEKYIQSQSHTCHTIRSFSTKDVVEGVSSDIKSLKLKISALQNSLEHDAQVISGLHDNVSEELKNVDVASRILDGIKSPLSGSEQYNFSLVSDYFWSVGERIEKRMKEYIQLIEELERNLPTFSQSEACSPEAINEVLKNIQESFLIIAGRIADYHEVVQEQKKRFLQFRRDYYHDHQNPFETRSKLMEISSVKESTKEQNLSLSAIAFSTLQPSTNTQSTATTAPSFGFGGSSLFKK